MLPLSLLELAILALTALLPAVLGAVRRGHSQAAIARRPVPDL